MKPRSYGTAVGLAEEQLKWRTNTAGRDLLPHPGSIIHQASHLSGGLAHCSA